MKHQIKPVPTESKQALSTISQIPIFDSLDGDEIKKLITHMGFFTAAAGDILFEEGEEGEHMCFIVSGAVDILKAVDDGGQVVLTTLKKGRSVGEMAVIDSLKRSATVKARVETNLLVISKTQFETLLKSQPVLGIKILMGIAQLLSQNLRKAATRLADYMLPLG